jgi:hypothetical protein
VRLMSTLIVFAAIVLGVDDQPAAIENVNQ